MLNVTNDRIMVIYEDGQTECLDHALESRKVSVAKNLDVKKLKFSIEGAQMGNELFSFVKKVDSDKIFCYAPLDEATLKPIQKYNKIRLIRPGQNVQLLSYTTIYNAKDISSSLITIWSDKRIFKQNLTADKAEPTIGVLHSIIEVINVRNDIAMHAISENCLAIYAGKQNDDGSNIVLYNIKYKIVQSILPFKVYLGNFKLWSVNENLYLSMGQHLSVIPFVVSADKLSSMIGSQMSNMEMTVEKEMINEDASLEDALEFDENQDTIVGMEFKPNDVLTKCKNKKKLLSGAKNIADSDDFKDSLDEICRSDLIVELIKLGEQAEDSSSLKLLNNVDESFPLLSENFELYCMNLERYGCSEIEITNVVVPILMKANRSEDIGLLLKRYNHVSERMLVQIVKYLISCPSSLEMVVTANDAKAREDMEVDNDKFILKKNYSVAGKNKFKNSNLLLSKHQSETRDVLSIVLCCAFDSGTILKYLNSYITLNEMIQIMDHLYDILTSDSFDSYEMRGNLVEGCEFDLDKKLFEWFSLLLDSHYQQILLSKDDLIKKKMIMWRKLIDDHTRILSQMKDLRYTFLKIANKKPPQLSRKCSQWYTIEKLDLY